MTTKRKCSQSTSRDGINFVRSLVERENSTFQEIDLHNDLGNDAYVEFVVEENATGCCVALQIKSGSSYRSSSGRYSFQADRDHFEYWASHTLPVLAVVFDPERGVAAWCDITDHLRSQPSIIDDGPYAIHVDREFSKSTFPEFRDYCLHYRDQYSREPNFGRALESFSARENVERCFDGLRALHAFHRNQSATWYYLISCISNYRGHPILRQLIVLLCHIPGHGDIFWGKQNIISTEVRRRVLLLMAERFDRRDAITLLSAIDEAGVDRGTIGQCVHALVDVMVDVVGVMESIAVDPDQDERIRDSAILFSVSSAQSHSTSSALAVLSRIRTLIVDDQHSWLIDSLEDDLRVYGYVALY